MISCIFYVEKSLYLAPLRVILPASRRMMAHMVARLFLTLTAKEWSNLSYWVFTSTPKGWLLAAKSSCGCYYQQSCLPLELAAAPIRGEIRAISGSKFVNQHKYFKTVDSDTNWEVLGRQSWLLMQHMWGVRNFLLCSFLPLLWRWFLPEICRYLYWKDWR